MRSPSDGPGLLRGLVSLTAGDVVARALSFLAFVYLARVLGVEPYGTLEFAFSLLLYLALLGDAGVELWATREAARSERLPALTPTVVALRLFFGFLALAGLLLTFGLLPDFSQLRPLLLVLGIGLVIQALNLKWFFLGQERMKTVARATVAGRLVFAGSVVIFVRSPDALVTVAVLHVLGDLTTALFFGASYLRSPRAGERHFSLREAIEVAKEALPLGAAQALGLLSYNFDSLFLGFLIGAGSVGIYNAAYKPVVALLAIPLTYFSGVFPSLSRFFAGNTSAFRKLAAESVDASAAVAVPIGVGGLFLAEPVVLLLFGKPYVAAGPVLSVLAWSAALVILRSTFRRALQAANQAAVDLRCAALATGLNVLLNLLLIPRLGLMGAAWATVLSELLWFGLLLWSSRELLPDLRLPTLLFRPVLAGAAMGGFLMVDLPLHWSAHGILALVVYGGALLLGGWRPPRFRYASR